MHHCPLKTSFFLIFFISSVRKERGILFKYLLKNYSFKEEFDVAIAYAGPMDFISFFVLEKVKARRKIQWIHFDVTKIGFSRNFAIKFYKKFDNVFVVSEEGKNKLSQILPSIKVKIEKFINVTDFRQIKRMADEGENFKDYFKGIRILTVGRLSKEKGQDLTIPVLAKLKQEGFNIRWYCIGEGSSRIEYEEMIKNYGVENDYILLGSNPNPYPFMKLCDIYVQPSRHEGYCITLAEAKCFNTPIVSTNFTGANEQLVHGKTGLIVNIDENEVYYAIKKLLQKDNLRNSFSQNLSRENSVTNIKLEEIFNI